ncbi:MvdC/MvdD family ATP grasp protein [Spirillospora sp. NPDC052269]
MPVLLCAEDGDGQALAVAAELDARDQPHVWFDTAWFPQRAELCATLRPDQDGAAGWGGTLATPRGVLDLARITAVYYQQSQPFRLPATLSRPEQRFATTEARFGIGGLLMSLPVRWISHPGRAADAEYKPLQLAVAARCGLPVPDTLITSSPAAAKEFAATRPAVYKALMHKLVAEAGEHARLIYTTPVAAAALDDRVRWAPHLFQHNIDKVRDVRLTATAGGHTLAVAITTDDPDARQDFRARYDALSYHPESVPSRVRDGCLSYLHALHLGMGVFDFAVDADGVWWFLECGPAARWGWLQDQTGAPIAGAIAETLTMDLR